MRNLLTGLTLITLGIILSVMQSPSPIEQRVNTACADVQKLYDSTMDDMTYRDTQIIQDDLQCSVDGGM